MKKLLLLLFIVIYFSSAHAQITGSDTACAGFIYSYNINFCQHHSTHRTIHDQRYGSLSEYMCQLYKRFAKCNKLPLVFSGRRTIYKHKWKSNKYMLSRFRTVWCKISCIKHFREWHALIFKLYIRFQCPYSDHPIK